MILRWPWIVAITALAAVVFLPLRFALALIDTPLEAQQASGTIWSGRLTTAQLGGLSLGTLDVGLDPLALFTGRAQLDFVRTDTNAPPLTGSLGIGAGGRTISHASGTLPATEIGEFPVEQVMMDAVSIRFSGDGCSAASGRVRLTIASELGSAPVRANMAGGLRCDGRVLLAPLISDSGAERLTLRISGDGRYTAALGTSEGGTLIRRRGQF
jgi:general secretion pathway protein N